MYMYIYIFLYVNSHGSRIYNAILIQKFKAHNVDLQQGRKNNNRILPSDFSLHKKFHNFNISQKYYIELRTSFLLTLFIYNHNTYIHT